MLFHPQGFEEIFEDDDRQYSEHKGDEGGNSKNSSYTLFEAESHGVVFFEEEGEYAPQREKFGSGEECTNFSSDLGNARGGNIRSVRKHSDVFGFNDVREFQFMGV